MSTRRAKKVSYNNKSSYKITVVILKTGLTWENVSKSVFVLVIRQFAHYVWGLRVFGNTLHVFETTINIELH